MILDASGKPISGDADHPVRSIEIVRSFSFKLNLGDYQSADFFCSRKEQATMETVDEISTSIYEWCYEEVMDSVREVKAAQARKKAAMAEKRSAA